MALAKLKVTAIPVVILALAVIGLAACQPADAGLMADQPPAATVPAAADPDSDGDGLPDFQEIHKYRTDPTKRDTAGRGLADGDWQERREFTYTVRAVLRLMPPYNLKAMNDDYQDVRILAETKDYAEVEVILYPLNTNADAIPGNRRWKKDYAGMRRYLAPGVTTNWDSRMQKDLLAELAKAGIDPDKLTDREVVEKVSRWLFSRAKFQNMFGTHFVHFPGGRPAVLPGLEAAFRREQGRSDWTAEEQFAHELLGKEMFYRRSHGTCTSAAVHQATVLRALGIPTRFIVAIPLVDASDPDQVAMAQKNLTHHGVRATLSYGLNAAGKNYTNHTFLEVFVGQRWRRLNYTRLGQNILDANYLGLMVHVHTFADLSEANLAATWGARYALQQRDATFRHGNPYRALVVEDHFGKYASLPNPPREHKQITITRIYWHDAADAPEIVRQHAGTGPAGAGRLFLHGEEWFEDAGDYLQYRLFLGRADKNFVLKAPGRPDLPCALSTLYFTQPSANLRDMELIIPPPEYARMVKGVAYTLHPANANRDYRWVVRSGLTITRQPTVEEKLEALQDKVNQLERRLEKLERK